MGNLFIVAHIPSIAFIPSHTHIHLQWHFDLHKNCLLVLLLHTFSQLPVLLHVIASSRTSNRFFEKIDTNLEIIIRVLPNLLFWLLCITCVTVAQKHQWVWRIKRPSYCYYITATQGGPSWQHQWKRVGSKDHKCTDPFPICGQSRLSILLE